MTNPTDAAGNLPWNDAEIILTYNNKEFKTFLNGIKKELSKDSFDFSYSKLEDYWNSFGMILLYHKEWDKAIKLYKVVINIIESREKQENKYFHKGTAYHNLGLAFLLRGDKKTCKDWVIKAFNEDMINTRGDLREVKLRPAFKLLQNVFYFDPTDKTKSKPIVKQKLSKKKISVKKYIDKTTSRKTNWTKMTVIVGILTIITMLTLGYFAHPDFRDFVDDITGFFLSGLKSEYDITITPDSFTVVESEYGRDFDYEMEVRTSGRKKLEELHVTGMKICKIMPKPARDNCRIICGYSGDCRDNIIQYNINEYYPSLKIKGTLSKHITEDIFDDKDRQVFIYIEFDTVPVGKIPNNPRAIEIDVI